MGKKQSKSLLHPWYKHKKYLHFDFALKKNEAVDYVRDEYKVSSHPFCPLIRYTKRTRQYKLDKETNELRVHTKPRHIFYSSHVDGYIYAYYSHILSEKYEEYLQENGLSENILAYRKINRGDQGASNIHFAREAFAAIRSQPDCNILCLDIKGFFDNLNVETLKKNWCRVLLKENSNQLPKDHYNVFVSLTQFRYVEEYDVIKIFKKEPRKREKVDRNDLEAVKQATNKTLHERICDIRELKKTAHMFSPKKQKLVSSKKKKLVREKDDLELKGIPQGTAISGMLSNIFMIDFDLAIKSAIEKANGTYRRYSDDILITFPINIGIEDTIHQVERILAKASGGSLVINRSKTEKRHYKKNGEKMGVCYDDEGNVARVQYLGFTFDGDKTHIRSSSMSKACSKSAYLIRKNTKGKNKKTNLNNIDTRSVYKAQSPRKITQQDKLKHKGFARYLERSADIHNSPEMRLQGKAIDRFLKKKIARVRLPKGKNFAKLNTEIKEE